LIAVVLRSVRAFIGNLPAYHPKGSITGSRGLEIGAWLTVLFICGPFTWTIERNTGPAALAGLLAAWSVQYLIDAAYIALGETVSTKVSGVPLCSFLLS
jgi:hypothetical protein